MRAYIQPTLGWIWYWYNTWQGRVRRMICVPRCSNVGLGSSALRAHTNPLSIFLFLARLRAISSLSTAADDTYSTGRSRFRNGCKDALLIRSLTALTCAL